MPCHIAPIALAASFGVETRGLQRPSIRAGLGARHPILYASFDQNCGSPVGGDPIYPTACVAGPAKQRAASTKTKANARLGTDTRLTLL
jgi:hypothetical protein